MPEEKDYKYSFIDHEFGGADFRDDAEIASQLLEGATPEQRAEIDKIDAETEAANAPAPEVPAVAEPVPAAIEPAPQSTYPQHWPYEDGSSVLVEQTPSGLKATLDPANGGRIEVFHGHDENELLRQILPAKLNASKKIRQQAQELKLRVRNTDDGQAPEAAIEQRPAPLTADEAFAFKTAFASDPAKALEDLLQRRTGMSLDEMTHYAKEGKAAADAIYLEVEVKAFRALHPNYFNSHANYRKLIGFLSVAKLDQDLPDGDMEATLNALYAQGDFNRDTLAEAYEALSDDGLLQVQSAAPTQVVAAVAPAPVVVPVAPQPVAQPVSVPVSVPAPPTPAIQATTVRPRAIPANYGLRQPASQPVVAEPDQGVPTVEEIEAMSDEERTKLLEAVYREHAHQSRTRR